MCYVLIIDNVQSVAGYDVLSSGLWTPKAVMKTLTTTTMKTRAVTMFSRRFNCMCCLEVEKRKENLSNWEALHLIN